METTNDTGMIINVSDIINVSNIINITNTSNSTNLYRPMSSSRFCYSKRQKMNLFESPFIGLSPPQKPCTSTILSSIQDNVTSNFKKFFYFQTFSPAYFHIKNSVLQTSKNTFNSTHFDRPISSSPFCYSKRQKMII